MRIGIVTGEYPPMQGGVGAYSQILAEGLQRAGHSVQVLTNRAGHSTTLPVTHVPAWGVRGLWTLRQWTQAQRLDVVNLQFQTAAYQMSPLVQQFGAWAGCPVITTFHDLRVPYLFPKAGRLREWAVRHLAQTSAGVIATNHEDYARLAGLRHAALIPIGSNILAEPAPLPVRQTLGAAATDFVIGYFGLINHSKGLDVLLSALTALRAQGLPARLVLIGGVAGDSDPTNAAYWRQLENAIHQQGLAPFVQVTGYLPEAAVAAYLQACDAVALPFRDGASFRRGSLMAALGYGCPLVTTQPLVSIPEFQDNVNMLLVQRDDVAALVAALQRLATDTALRERLGQGAKRLAQQFAWEAIVQQTAAFYAQVVGR